MPTSTLLPSKEVAKTTTEFYDRHTDTYVNSTLSLDMSALYERFLYYVPPRGVILDAGSGSGRDTKAFLERGYEVEAFDSSVELCSLSSRLTGVRTQLLSFQEFAASPRYDGIWACASLLHVPKEELQDALCRLIQALKPTGALYVSFRLGCGDRISEDGRFYTDLDLTSLRDLLSLFPNMRIVDIWVSTGEGTLQGKGKWINAIGLKIQERGER